MISLMLATTMFLGTGLRAAASGTIEVGSTDVTANYVAGEAGGQIISVDIKWEGMSFTYNGESAPSWNPETHEYDEGRSAGWDESTAYIAIINHSNVILQAGINYTGEPDYPDMDLLFTDRNPFVGSAETSEGVGEKCEVIIRSIPSGELPADTKTDAKVGQIKVTVTPVEYLTAFGTLEERYSEVPVKSDALSRGAVYYETETDYAAVIAAYDHVAEVDADPDSGVPEKNLALNKLIMAYYNQMHLMQEQPEN